MNRLIYAAAIALTASAGAADWERTLLPTRPGIHPLPAPSRVQYRLSWAGISAGKAAVVSARSRKDRLRLEIDASTTGLARSLWRLDVHHAAEAAAPALRPVAVEQREKYQNETVLTKLQFDREGVTRLRTEQPAGNRRAKAKRFKLPGLFDLHTALLWIRSQPLARGDVYRLVIYPGTAPYLAEVAVMGNERVRVGNRDWETKRLALKLQRIDAKTRELQAHRSFKTAQAWISDDPERLFVKARAEIFVGSVWMEMESVDFASTGRGSAVTPR